MFCLIKLEIILWGIFFYRWRDIYLYIELQAVNTQIRLNFVTIYLPLPFTYFSLFWVCVRFRSSCSENRYSPISLLSPPLKMQARDLHDRQSFYDKKKALEQPTCCEMNANKQISWEQREKKMIIVELRYCHTLTKGYFHIILNRVWLFFNYCYLLLNLWLGFLLI